MAYTKRTWLDRVVQFPMRFRDQNNNQLTLTADSGTITQAGTPINAANLNQLEQGVDDAHALNVDDVTVVDTAAPTGDIVAPKTLFNWFANMIKQITGKANWRTTPRTSLENAVKLNGDTMTGLLTAKGTTGTIASTVGTAASIEVRGGGTVGDAAYMTFHRPGSFAAQLGLDTDNKWKVGGWSAGAVAYELWHDARMRVHSSGSYIEWNKGGTWFPMSDIQVGKPRAASANSSTNPAVYTTVLNITGVMGRIDSIVMNGGYSAMTIGVKVTIDGVVEEIIQAGLPFNYLAADAEPIYFYSSLKVEVKGYADPYQSSGYVSYRLAIGTA